MKKTFLFFATAWLVAGIIAIILSASSETLKYSEANVNKKEGKFIFTSSEPTHNYEVVFKIKINVVWSNKQVNSVNKIENLVLKRMRKASFKNGFKYDGIIIGSSQYFLAIKFN